MSSVLEAPDEAPAAFIDVTDEMLDDFAVGQAFAHRRESTEVQEMFAQAATVEDAADWDDLPGSGPGAAGTGAGKWVILPPPTPFVRWLSVLLLAMLAALAVLAALVTSAVDEFTHQVAQGRQAPAPERLPAQVPVQQVLDAQQFETLLASYPLDATRLVTTRMQELMERQQWVPVWRTFTDARRRGVPELHGDPHLLAITALINDGQLERADEALAGLDYSRLDAAEQRRAEQLIARIHLRTQDLRRRYRD